MIGMAWRTTALVSAYSWPSWRSNRCRFVVPGDEIRTELDFHRVLARQLEFGEYYGWNLAALRDRLLLDVPRPVELIWERSAASKRYLGADLFESICETLREAEAQDRRFGWEDRFVLVLR
jgi:ribonuclease inhibitor